MNLVEEYTSINSDSDVEFRYAYRLTKREFRGITAYGIEIERKDYVGLKSVNLERESIDIISIHRHKVKQLLMKLYSNQVSPVHLIDIVGSYADEHAYEFDLGVDEKVIN
ncbi:hypothetical protein D2A34_05045 [Clostridium chromiireducens]|uniref:Uncharacterized protein n=1 Tax=Clostridium chromiireducens TaxID=225345 RepID=A0A399IUK5_9CLOT|nr:DUF6514 family protein [Clostridium chromiireducens]MVX62978.1 hypothetical protein [Clostridium chromiireducens]RII36753.1 hypothetical protein D2A34_05045 [Clostridium chromiireducens]